MSPQITTNKLPHIKWNSHYTVEHVPVELNDGDKIILPSSALEQLLAQAQDDNKTLPSPLTFQLRHPHSSAIIHGGVKEFSSPENTIVQIPLSMMKSLGLNQGDHVLIKLLTLPKGTFARLKPMSNDYHDIPDYRAALEAHLRGNYNTLTKGQVLSCRYGGKVYQFKVAELKPEDAVSITDTDLEVDLESIDNTMVAEKEESMDEDSRNHNRDSVAEVVNLDQIVSKLSLSEPHIFKYYKLKLGIQKDVLLELNVESGDADVVISNDEDNKWPTLEDHEQADLTSDASRVIKLSNLTSNTLYVGIQGYTPNTIISWKSTSLKDKESGDNGMDVDSQPEEDHAGKMQCKNCHAWILERTAVLHEGFCLRNNTVCVWGCGKVFKKDSEEYANHWHCDQCDYTGVLSDKEKHIEYQHTVKKCKCTTFETHSYQALAQHRHTTCSEKLILCQYCHILTAQGELSLDSRDRLLGLRSHESYCGSRTIECQKCHKSIPIKEIQVHAKIHEVKRQQQTLPPACCNRNCIRPSAKNRLSFCQYCFGPFWTTEDDPKNAKLIQRVARKIHSQLTVGCGNTWCRNKNCATSTNDPKDATTAASLLIPMVKLLPKQLSSSNPRPELYFCVDESTTRKKFLAELLHNEHDGNYDLGWCVKALENEQEDLDKAKIWLDRNAPRNKYKS